MPRVVVRHLVHRVTAPVTPCSDSSNNSQADDDDGDTSMVGPANSSQRHRRLNMDAVARLRAQEVLVAFRRTNPHGVRGTYFMKRHHTQIHRHAHAHTNTHMFTRTHEEVKIGDGLARFPRPLDPQELFV